MTAFETVYSMISHEEPRGRDIVLPARVVRRQSCGCPAGTLLPVSAPAA